MKGVWKCSLGVCLGWVAGAAAEEAQWRPVAKPAQAAQAAPPAHLPAIATSGPVLAEPRPGGGPVVGLGKPRALAPAPQGEGVSPASYSTPSGRDASSAVVRSQSLDVPRPMPVGPPTMEKSPGAPKVNAFGVSRQSPPKPDRPPRPDQPEELKMPRQAPAEAPGQAPPPLGPSPAPAPAVTPVPPLLQGPHLEAGPEIPAPEAGGPCPSGSCFAGPVLVDGDGVVVEGEALYSEDGECCTCGQLYGRVEYLMWFLKGADMPPLVTGGRTGVLGAPGTRVLFGGSDVRQGLRSGARFTGGYWFDPERTVAVEASLFFLGRQDVNYYMSSAGRSGGLLARPFFDLNTRSSAVRLLASPGERAGAVQVGLDTCLWGKDVSLVANYCDLPGFRFNVLAGARFVELEEDLRIQDATVTLAAPRTSSASSDQILTNQKFFGPQVGAAFEWRFCRWMLEGSAKVGLGVYHQQADVTGLTLNAADGGFTARPGGLLALPSNSGNHERTRFGMVTDLGMNLGYQLTDNIRIFAGYNFLLMPASLRAGSQIDPVINTTQFNGRLQGAARPAYVFRTSNFMAHGTNFGLEFRY
jgi:hypothetical protein